MAISRPLQPVSEWDPRLRRMLAVSLAGHVVVLVLVVVLTPLAAPRPLPMIAYTVEITDPNALGGRTPPGAPGKKMDGGATVPAPAGGSPKPPEPEAVKVPEPKVEARPEPKPEPKPVPPKPEVRPEPKPEPVAMAEPVQPVVKPEPRPEPKAEAKKPESAKPDVAAAAKPAASAAAAKAESNGRPGGQAAADSPPRDAYGAAAERWRQRAGGGGLGGQDTGSGPIGAGGDGKGGGGQLVGLEFLAYRQQVINAVKGAWANVLTRPGLVAKVRFEIAADGAVSAVRLEQSSGNAAYDASALRAVQRANPLPPPPAHYAGDFHDFVIDFHSEETGGQGTG